MAFGGAFFPVILYTALAVLSFSTSTASHADACNPSPCLHGSCYWGPTGLYKCVCDQGWTGVDCDQSAISTTTSPDHCLSNPCIYGTCTSQGTHVTCTCQIGYTGSYCNQVLDPCQPDPCMHGSCFSSGANFFCQCTRGYTGTHCNITISTTTAPDPCLPNPCIYGTCTSQGTHVTCTCQSGFTGSYCNQECTDAISNCADYTLSVCSNADYATWVSTNCAKFCGKCSSSSGGGEPPPQGCVYNGFIYQQGQTWKDACMYTCSCVDGASGKYQCHDLCVAWILPSQCHLNPPAPGKCCQTPSCPIGYYPQYPSGYWDN